MAILLGTIFGGMVVLLPYGEMIISLSLIAFAALGLISSWYIPSTQIQNLSLKINYNFFAETFSIISYAKRRWDLFLCIIGISWFWLLGAVYLAEFPVFVKEILNANE